MERFPPQTYKEARLLAGEYAQGIGSYLEDAGNEGVLRPHQLEVFNDVQTFFEEGNTRGFINLPTGTGKTVLFVEMTKALIAGRPPGERPKVLVVTPTKDLVHQTLGRSGKKGYGRFASDLQIGSYFSDSTRKERENLDDYDVVVTTYHSLSILHSTQEMRPVSEDERQAELAKYYHQLVESVGRVAAQDMFQIIPRNVPTGRRLLDKFDVLILDEAHHALRTSVQGIIRSLPPRKVVVGFTATPDANEQRRLQTTLPNRIHEMSLGEAIQLGLLAPVVPMGVRSGVRIVGSDIYNDRGEFIDERISYLARDKGRNEQILQAAEVLAGEGIGTIVSCIAGGGAWHANHIARVLQKRGVKAAAVHSGVTSIRRQKLYEQFEAGELDVLTFIGVLGEGWDSERAKGLINGRPTRSLLFAPQRLGRVTRPGNVAFTIDICDEYPPDYSQNPPITVADVLRDGMVELGKAVGDVPDEGHVQRVLHLLQERVALMPRLENNYTDFKTMLASLSQLERGVVTLDTGGLYAVPGRIISNHGAVDESILLRAAELQGREISTVPAVQSGSIRTAYNVREAQIVLQALPKIEPDRYHIDDEGTKWLAARGLAKLFSKRYPEVNEDLVDQLLDMVGQNLSWLPARHMTSPPNHSFARYETIKLYRHEEATVSHLNSALRDYFGQEV